MILAYWHEDTLTLTRFFIRRLLRRGVPLAMLASLSRDGEIGARLASGWGAEVFRGSASRGGTAGLRRLYRYLKGGGSVILAPDGPRGPAHEAKPGAVVLAQMTGAPVVPVVARADRDWRLGSWDRMRVPKPFARIRLALGESPELPRGLPLEEGRERLGGALDRTVRLASADDVE